MIKTREMRRLRPQRPILEGKSGDEKTSKVRLQKVVDFIFDMPKPRKVRAGQHQKHRNIPEKELAQEHTAG